MLKVPKPLKGITKVIPKWKSSSTSEVLDGKKVRSLLQNEKELHRFLSSYFDLLDADSSGTLSKEEMRPALTRFGELLGLPPAGTVAEADALTDHLFTSLMADSLWQEIDRDTFVTISKEFLAGTASSLQEKPLVVEVYNGAVLQELADNEELFDVLVEDFFAEFDEDGSGKLSRDELGPALVKLGLLPPAGAKPEADTMLVRILGRFGGTELELGREQFKHLLRQLLQDLAAELQKAPLYLPDSRLGVPSAGSIRKLLKDTPRFRAFASDTFRQWDVLKRGRLSRGEVLIGFKALCAAHGVPLAPGDEAEAMVQSSVLFIDADVDGTGHVDRAEFDQLLEDILGILAQRLEHSQPSPGGGTTNLLHWFSSPAAGTSRVGSSGGEPRVIPHARSADAIKGAYAYQASAEVLEARRKMQERGEKLKDVAADADDLAAQAEEFKNLSAQLSEKMKTRWW